ncbi:hypothetical protein HY374_01860 [Candidatus Berkelbacteria bacterium]|nr:hypothetical protein [Candidatus Berkelbacteria bacterium]
MPERHRPAAGAGWLGKFLRTNVRFGELVMELAKNGLDWRMEGIDPSINFSYPQRDTLRCVDNGRGMPFANRHAFLAINASNADPSVQAGLHCTGIKRTLFGLCKAMTARTVDANDPDKVWSITLTPEEYERVFSDPTAEFEWESTSRTAKNWPYPHNHGTEITAVLAHPRSSTVLRGEKLAEMLSARLPLDLVLSGVCTVDNHPIKSKEIVEGTLFELHREHRVLGRVDLQLYRPTRTHPEEQLRLAPFQVGEVPMSTFVQALGHLAGDVPSVFLADEVAGVIRVPYLRDYVAENRAGVEPEIVDDPRTDQLLMLLREVGPAVMRRLGIEFRTTVDSQQDQGAIEEVVEEFNRKFNPDGVPPPWAPPPPPGDDEEGIGDGDTTEKQVLLLSSPSEVELGEAFEVIARIRSQDYSPEDLVWTTEYANAELIRQVGTVLQLRATEVGKARVIATLPGVHQKTHYRVVRERSFRLSPEFGRVKAGENTLVFAHNADKLTGELRWELEGVGELQPEGNRARYFAPPSALGEQVIIRATDTRNPEVWAESHLTLLPFHRPVIWIEGQCFEYEWAERSQGDAQLTRTIRMRFLGEESIHRMEVNRQALGYRLAVDAGHLATYLRREIARSYVEFEALHLADDHDDVPRSRLPAFFAELAARTDTIVEKLVTESE